MHHRFHSVAPLAAAAAALAPEPRAYLESLVRVAGPIELGPCLARAGYRVERVGYRGYTPRALALELLKVTSYSMQRAEIFKTLEGSAFRAGDIIREVDGAPVDSVPAIEPLLARARRRVAVTLLRDGALQTVELPIPRVSPKERARHERLTIAELDASHAASPFSTAPSASAPE